MHKHDKHMSELLIWLAVLAGALMAFLMVTTAYAAVTDEVTNPSNLQDQLPLPQQWQALCIVFGPVAIAFVTRWIATATHKTLTKSDRKIIAGLMILCASIVGMHLDGQLDHFTPTIAGLVYMFVGVQSAYDKMWQSIPGLTSIIGAIDPAAKES